MRRPCPRCAFLRKSGQRDQECIAFLQRGEDGTRSRKNFLRRQNVVPYNNLGIGRLIYQLPIPLCEMFMTEVFGENLPDTFDEETLTTINKFFENNLNVSETSRQLYVHRNTLVYRLEKLEKSTGLEHS